MGLSVHTVELLTGSSPLANPDRLKLLLAPLSVPAAGAAVTALGSITAGTGFDVLPVIAPTGGTLTAGVSPAVPAVVRATSIKAVGTPTVVSPGAGVAINDTFNLSGGILAAAGPNGNALAAAGVPAKVTATHIQAMSAVVNAGGSGGTPGAVTVTGTTGTGTKFQATGTINGSGVLTGPLTITVPGDYTANPTIAGDTITGGSLSGATVTLVMGALTLSLTTAGGYTVAPVLAGAPGVNVVGSGTGVVIASTYGLGTAVIDESGNYSGAPSWTVTAADGNGSGASIATGTLGGAGASVIRQLDLGAASQYATVLGIGNTALDAVVELQSVVGPPLTNGINNPNNSAPYVSVAVQPRLAASTLTAGQVNLLIAA